MKAYNLATKVIEVAGNKIPVIQLGESGRGRLLFTVPCPEGLQDGDAVTAVPAQVKANGLKTKPSIKESNDPDTGAMFRIPGRFQGKPGSSSPLSTIVLRLR